jgi:hypothetical protein
MINFKKTISSVISLFVALCSITGLPADATTKNVYVDNDDSQGHSNGQDGFSTLISGYSHYRYDARTQVTGNSNNVYEWYLNDDMVTSSNSISLYLYAYMNDISFTDPHAKYDALCSYVSTVNSAFNQNTAYGGWNLVGTVSLTPYTAVGENTVTLHGASVRPYYYSGYTTAADGVRFYTIS